MSSEKTAKKLTTRGRKQIKGENFVFPGERRYPIHDLSHARNALARVAQHGTPAEQSAVRREVHEKYPGLKNRTKEKTAMSLAKEAAEKTAAKPPAGLKGSELRMWKEMGQAAKDNARSGTSTVADRARNYVGRRSSGGWSSTQGGWGTSRSAWT